jgi:uncharacterized membrane protein
MNPVTRLRALTVVALIGLLVSLYLLLYHLGFYGTLVCGTGSCEVVQTSKYARFLGQPVPAWGTAWYGGVFCLGLIGLGPAWERRWVDLLIGLAATGGLLFSVYLTGVEILVLHAVCWWCVLSAVLTVLIFLLARPWRLLRRETDPG